MAVKLRRDEISVSSSSILKCLQFYRSGFESFVRVSTYMLLVSLTQWNDKFFSKLTIQQNQPQFSR